MSIRTVSWEYLDDDVEWEYEVEKGGLWDVKLMNAFGQNGWQLCAIAFLGRSTPESVNEYAYYFKRARRRLKDKKLKHR